jgi:hypothetical protein
MKTDLARLNIERFRRLLHETTDAAKRKVIQKLLDEEESKRAREGPAGRPDSSSASSKN